MKGIPQLYGIAKVHKVSILGIPLRLVHSQCAGISAVASKYIDHYLQKLIRYIPGYVKNSRDVIN